jgi:hypothetical protein
MRLSVPSESFKTFFGVRWNRTASFSNSLRPSSMDSARCCSATQWRTRLRAREVLTKFSQSRARAGVTDLRVNHVGEVNGRGPARELDDFAHRGEGIHVLRVEVELEAFEEVARVLDLLRPLDQRAEPLESLVVVMRAAAALFVLPMSGHALFGDAVHFFGANLHLEWLSFAADDRGVERAVEIVARRRNPVFEAAGHGLPEVVDDAEGRVTMAHLVGRDDARGDEIVDLIERNLLPLELLPD